MKRSLKAAVAVVAVLAMAAPSGAALAMGSDSGSSSSGTSESGTSGSAYMEAKQMVDAGLYAAAIPKLQAVVQAEPQNADAFNLLGYSHRQLGQTNPAYDAYVKALQIDPNHLGANEYLGELYLQLGQLDAAEQRLQVLDDACFFGCAEYDELKAKIEAYKAQHSS
jgi:Flp pilus assembly protein TadD